MKHTAQMISAMSNLEFISKAWELTTNKGACSHKGMKAALKRIRQLGGQYYLALYCDKDNNRWTSWGVTGNIWWSSPHYSKEDVVYIAYGRTLQHCAHKLGNGDAHTGWNNYWYW